MDNTVERLLAIKTQREKRLRANLARVMQQQQELEQRYYSLRQQRQLLRQTWRELSRKGGFFERDEFEQLQIQLERMQERDKHFVKDFENLKNQQNELQEKHQQISQEIKTVLREQEKLKALLELEYKG